MYFQIIKINLTVNITITFNKPQTIFISENPMFLETNNIELPQTYQLLVNSIIPRPIAWISTVDKNGNSNLAPYSFFSVASVNPPVLTVTAVPSSDKLTKDTLQNLMDTQQAVVHIVTEEFAQEMNASCADYPHGTSEIDALQLQTVASTLVKPPSIAGTKVRYECSLREVIEVAKKPGGGRLILLDVLGIYVDDSVASNGHIVPSELKVLGKLGGNDYSDTQITLSMARPER